jgi:predicted nucleic acid-binding protein
VKLLLDTNVVFDVLTRREPWWEASASVMSLLEAGQIRGFVAAHTITTLHYLSSKHLGPSQANAAIIELLNIASVIPSDQTLLLRALSLGWSDFEDAGQAVAAVVASADFIVTRNTADFSASPVQSVSPSELLAILRTDAP